MLVSMIAASEALSFFLLIFFLVLYFIGTVQPNWYMNLCYMVESRRQEIEEKFTSKL